MNHPSLTEHTKSTYEASDRPPQGSLTAAEAIAHEFIVESAIAPDVFDANVRIVDDLEIDPVTNEVLSTPIDDALGRRYTRFTWQAKHNRRAALFLAEDGSCWQAKVFGVKAKDKSGQYLAPKGTGDVPYLPTVPHRAVEATVQRHELPSPTEGESFWEWFQQHKQIPLIITEGGKKALAAISQEQVALSLYGCLCGVGSNPFGVKPSLLPYVEGREVIIAFDRDTKPKAAKAVIKGINRLAKAIALAGGKPKVALWDKELGKGLDDLIASSPEAFRGAINQAIPFAQFASKLERDRFNKLRSLSYRVDLALNAPLIPEGTAEQVLAHLPKNKKGLPYGILAIKSPKGSGKSSRIIRPLKEELRELSYSVVSAVPRKALGRAQAKEWGLEWIEEADIKGVSKRVVLENASEIGCCWDSLHKLGDRDWSKTALIVDESEAGFDHLLASSTLKEKRSQVLDTFEKAIAYAHQDSLVILADADLSDASINYVKELNPDAPIFTVVNSHLPQAWEVEFHTGKNDTIKAEIFSSLRRGERLAIACDAQSEAEAIDRELAKEFPDKKVIRIDSSATQNEFGRKFVKNINQAIASEQPDVLIYTNSLGMGVSIEVDWFTKVYGLFFGVLAPAECRQMLARVRKPVPRAIWSAKSSTRIPITAATDPKEVNENLQLDSQILAGLVEQSISDLNPREKLQKLITLTDPKTGLWNTPHINAYCGFKARENYALRHLQEVLIEELKREGHHLTFSDSREKTKEAKAIKESKEEIRQEEAEAIANAPEISEIEIESLSRSSHLTIEEKQKLSKAILQRELPGVELTPEFVYKAVVKDRRRWLNEQKLFFALSNPETALKKDLADIEKLVERFEQGVAYLPDLRGTYHRVKLLEKLEVLKILDLDNPGKQFRATDEELLQLKERCLLRDARRLLRSLFAISVSKKTRPVDLLGRLAQTIGISLKRVGRDATGDRTWVYQVDEEKLNDPDRLDVLKSLSRRFAETFAPSGLDPVYYSSEEYITNREVIDGRTAPNHDEGGELQDLATWLAGCDSPDTLRDLLSLGVFDLNDARQALPYVPPSRRSFIESWIGKVAAA